MLLGVFDGAALDAQALRDAGVERTHQAHVQRAGMAGEDHRGGAAEDHCRAGLGDRVDTGDDAFA